MSAIRLTPETEIETDNIISATLSKKGAKISAKAVTVASGSWDDLTVPEDVLIVRLNDASELAIRGDAAQNAFGTLRKVRDQQGLAFELQENAAE